GRVTVARDGALNSPQTFDVVLEVRDRSPATEVTIDDLDDGFQASPCFWVGHRFCRCPPERRGYNGFYRTNGGIPAAGKFARFTPDLRAGTYAVSFSEATPFRPDAEFAVRVRHRGGVSSLRVRPDRSRKIGVFEFAEGTDGFVEISAEGATGLVIADAIAFKPG
ncbi:MAG: hypothetical protein JJ992_03035, partial [Planctomycetes bacterium]|nr:hypothetical protein [Planctomycetota bacterium]